MSNRQLWKAVLPFMEVGDDGTTLVADSTKMYGVDNLLIGQQAAKQMKGSDAAFSSNAYTTTLPNPPSAYYDGMVVNFKVANNNTGAATLSVTNVTAATPNGAKSLQFIAGTGLSANAIVANKIYSAVYSAVDDKFILISGA